MKGKVTKAVASRFEVLCGDKSYCCFGRKKLKFGGDIYVGDDVEISVGKEAVIEKVYPRKNSLVRPYVANVDVCLVVVAPEPTPDFLLVDKILVNCFMNGIEPVLVANKTDLDELSLAEYDGIVETHAVSAENGNGISELFSAYSGKVVCFAGQSAVGKSSIINAAFNDDCCETGELSKRIARGKNTTRQTAMLSYGNTLVVDTCGFSMLELPETLEPADLCKYYPDFLPYVSDCKFRNACSHISEPVCGIKACVGKEISRGRYERYKELFHELSETKKKLYG